MTDPSLIATYYIDADHPAVMTFADAVAGRATSPRRQAVELFYAVRDGFRYNPYAFTLEREKYKASHTLAAGEGFCIQKAILLAAAARALTIPARLGFGNVKNHLATERLKRLMGTDLFVFHGYTVLFLENRWVKATPAFNLSLCEKFKTRPLEFDGRSDAVFHAYDQQGHRHMEYVHDYGVFDDFPLGKMIEESKKYYPAWFADDAIGTGMINEKAVREKDARGAPGAAAETFEQEVASEAAAGKERSAGDRPAAGTGTESS